MYDFKDVEKQVLESETHLVLLDVNLQNKNGYEICR